MVQPQHHRVLSGGPDGVVRTRPEAATVDDEDLAREIVPGSPVLARQIMESIGRVLTARILGGRPFPSTLEDLDLDPFDLWGQPYSVRPATRLIVSGGPDGRIETADGQTAPAGDDLVVVVR